MLYFFQYLYTLQHRYVLFHSVIHGFCTFAPYCYIKSPGVTVADFGKFLFCTIPCNPSFKIPSLFWPDLNFDRVSQHSEITSYFKGTLSCLRQFLATGSPLKLIKKAFYFIVKALFFFKIFKFMPRIFSKVEKQLA